MQEEPTAVTNRKEIIKDEILDESFKKAEISLGIRSPVKKTDKKPYEKTFPKFGLLLIIFAVIGLICIYQVTWAYIKYDTDEGRTEVLIYKDYIGENIEKQSTLSLFQNPHYIGISVGDFTDTPRLASYGFFSLIILGALITLFGILDKKRNFPIEISILTHFMLATVTIIPSLFIVLSAMKFLGAHFLFFDNMSLIQLNIGLSNVILFFPTAFILIVLGFITIKIVFTIIRMDFNEIQKIKETTVSKQPFSDSEYSGEFR
jgi:hypothetical protein